MEAPGLRRVWSYTIITDWYKTLWLSEDLGSVMDAGLLNVLVKKSWKKDAGDEYVCFYL